MRFIRWVFISIAKLIGTAASAVIMGTIIGLVAGSVMVNKETRKLESDYTHEELIKIKPDVIIDEFTLISDDHFSEFTKNMVNRLVENQILINTPIGLVYTDIAYGQTFKVLIQSPGGQVTSGLALSEFFSEVKSRGVKIECHVSKAASMGFYLMAKVCDKVIAKKDVYLMQHRVSYRGWGVSPSTYKLDIELNQQEAEALKVDEKVWMGLARGEEDHVFTKAEIEKYKLVDEWVD